MQFDAHTFSFLMRELLSSVRVLNWRLRELKWTIQNGYVKGDERKPVLEKIERVMETKMCLIYSIYDIRQRFLKELGNTGDDEFKKCFSLANLLQELKDI